MAFFVQPLLFTTQFEHSNKQGAAYLRIPLRHVAFLHHLQKSASMEFFQEVHA